METLRVQIVIAAAVNLALFIWFVWWCAQILKRKCAACGYRNRGTALPMGRANDVRMTAVERETLFEAGKHCKRCQHDLTI